MQHLYHLDKFSSLNGHKRRIKSRQEVESTRNVQRNRVSVRMRCVQRHARVCVCVCVAPVLMTPNVKIIIGQVVSHIMCGWTRMF